MNEPLSGTLAKLTTEGGKALLALPERGRALVKRVPPPVQIELKKLSTRGAHVCREIFAGILVVGLVIIVAGYGRLGRGPVSLPSLVPTIEAAINGELSDLQVKIDDAILQRSPDGPGVLFRLRNIRLMDKNGAILAQAPLAAIGLSGSALLSGRIAPGSVDFIGPRLLLFYDADRGLALTFSRPTAAESQAAVQGSLPASEPPTSGQPQSGAPETIIAKRPEIPAPGGRVLDVTSTVAEVFERARSGNTSYLTRFGVKNALVVLNQNGTETSWQVPDFSIDLEHKNSQRSLLVGQANIASSKGDWQLEVRTEQRVKRQSLGITALIQNLVPSGIAGNFPSLGALKALDMVVNGETTVELSDRGEFLTGSAKLELEGGQITPPWDPDTAMHIDHGNLDIQYLKDRDIVEIAPSTLIWGKSKATISGEFRPVRDASGTPASWNFALRANDATLAVEEFGLAPMKVDEWQATGSISPKGVTVSHFIIRSGTASISFSGSFADAPGSPEVHLTGAVSPMPVDTLKLLWPKFLAGKARAWVLERVTGGEVLGGKFNVSLAPGQLAQVEAGGALPADAVNVELDFSGMSIAYLPKMPPVMTGDAKLMVSGIEFAVAIPQGRIVVPSGQQIALSQGRFFIPDLRQDPQQGEITFRADGATPTMLELLDHEPLGYITSVGLKPNFLGGTASGNFALTMPLKADLEFNQIKLAGKARLNDAITSNLAGGVNVEGGNLDVNLTDQAVEAKGQITIKGVPAELAWQHIFYTPADRQPPIRVTASLDEAARDKLGIKVNHLVQGPTPVTLSVSGLGEGSHSMSMQADLTNARLLFGSMGWTKPVGRTAIVQFNVVPKDDGSTDLENFKILGDDITVEGAIALDAEQHLKEFYFSDFSVNRGTHVEITAMVRDDNVLDIKAQGPSFDGKQFFQSLFSAGQLAEEGTEAADPFGVDFSAEIGTVFGFYDTMAKDVKVTLKKRNGRLVALDARADLNGNSPTAVDLEQSEGARVLKAEAHDAGAAFRLVGFYPSVEGGEASLQVNLDAGAAGSKSGTLWARNFTVLGDSVVNDVLTDPNSTAVLGENKQQVTRQRIAFDQLRAPFTVGGGKFRLRDAYMNGSQLGATMRGAVDFKAQTVDLGGTYVPLYGLNSALGAIPILGKVFVGRQGEGVVGITFAIKGSLDDPEVLVNPISAITPGIFRQIFDFTGSVPDAAAASSGGEFMAPSTQLRGNFVPPPPQ
jgi:hypothetical protein